MGGVFRPNAGKDIADGDGPFVFDSGAIPVSTITSIPSTNATWTKYTSGVEATLATALTDAGYVTARFEFAAGTKTTVRIPCYLTT